MKNQKIYKSLGFVEALISILVAGVASVVLLSIATATIQQVLENEMGDKLTEVATQGAEMIKKISEDNNNNPETLFPPISGNVGRCFALNNDLGQPAFVKQGTAFVHACSYDSQGKDSCTNYPSNDPDIFRVYCITSSSDSASGTTVGKIITGLVACKSGNTKGNCSVPDYPYVVVVKTTQK